MIPVNLSEDVVKYLQVKANARNFSIDDYLRNLMEQESLGDDEKLLGMYVKLCVEETDKGEMSIRSVDDIFNDCVDKYQKSKNPK